MFEILAFENINFTNKESGEVVCGTKFYLRSDEEIKNGAGYPIFTRFVPTSKIIGQPKVGAICEFKISFNSKGEARICGCSIS